MKPSLSILTLSLLLGACSSAPPAPHSGIQPPARWQSPHTSALRQDNLHWWRNFDSTQLDQLIEQARSGNPDVAAAMARVRQARAASVVAGGPLLPEVSAKLNASRQKLLRGNGYSGLDASADNKAVDSFDANLSASYELDFWGAKAAARDSAVHSLQASEFDQATVELTLFGDVADRYLQALAFDQQVRIAQLNLANAERVLSLVETRYQAGSATALELAQQRGLVAAQQRQLPLLQQQATQARIALAVLLGQPVQNLTLQATEFTRINAPGIGSGVPSELLTRRPDVAAAESRLAAAQADVTVARAAMLPSVTLTATLGSGAGHAADVLRSPFYSLAAGLVAPIFNNGRLSAQRDQAKARQEELLQAYRATLITAFADVEQALNSIAGLDRQRDWQAQEVEQAQRAFEIAQNRYQAGAEVLLSVLESQRTLYQSQDLEVQLRLQRLQASIALYKALGGGWEVR